MSVGGGVLAYDHTTQMGNVFGLGGSYVYTHVSDADDLGDANIDQGFLTFYTTLKTGSWYTDVSVWGGYYSGSNVRKVQFPTVQESAKATIQGLQTAGHLEMGYNYFGFSECYVEWFGLEPFVSGDWVGNWEGSFHEHGAESFNIGQNSRFASFLRAETGLRFHEMIRFEDEDKLVLSEKVSYAYQKTFGTGKITAFLVGSPETFSVSTLTGAQNLGVLEFSVLYYRASGTYVDMRAQGEFGSEYCSVQGMFEIGYDL